MASHRGHISIALLFGVALLFALGSTAAAAAMPLPRRALTAVGMLWAGVLFALFPDVDIKSRGQMLFYRLFVGFDVLLIATGQFVAAAYFGLLALVPIISRHRGWTHSYVAMLAVPLPILLVPMYLAAAPVLDGLPYYLGAVAGYFSHLVADGMVFRRR
jgi:membrane-bound metal-dependent hydrolase YbcI (DUF457 family)